MRSEFAKLANDFEAAARSPNPAASVAFLEVVAGQMMRKLFDNGFKLRTSGIWTFVTTARLVEKCREWSSLPSKGIREEDIWADLGRPP